MSQYTSSTAESIFWYLLSRMSLTNFTLSAHIVILRRLRMELSVMLIFHIWWLLTISKAESGSSTARSYYCQIIVFKVYSLLSCCIRRGVSSCFAVGVLRSNEAEVKRRGCSSFNAGGGGGGGKGGGGGCLLCPTYLLISHRVHLIVNYVIQHFWEISFIHGGGLKFWVTYISR